MSGLHVCFSPSWALGERGGGGGESMGSFPEQRLVIEPKLEPTNFNSVILNSLLFGTLTVVSLGFSIPSFTIGYFKVLLFQTNFHLPCRFEIAGINFDSLFCGFHHTEKYHPETIY